MSETNQPDFNEGTAGQEITPEFSEPYLQDNTQIPAGETIRPNETELFEGPPQTAADRVNPYPPVYPETLPPAVTRRKPKKKKAIAAGIAALYLFSAALFGFSGARLANRLDQTGTSGTSSTVLYQSVIKTVSSGATSKELSIADVAATVKDSVVEITTEIVTRNSMMGQMISTGAGSGVIVSTDGYIVTNNHVIDGASAITVRLSDETEYTATLVGTDAQTDLAVIKIAAMDCKPAVLGTSGSLVVGQTAVAIGNPLGELGGTVTQGIISALDREISIDGETMSLLQTDTAINPGNSGGGLFNLYGELVGIVNAKSSGSDIEGLGFAIPIDTAKAVIEQIIENGYVKGRIDTGFTLVDIQDTQTAMSYRVNTLGLYISKSDNGSFRSGDIITAVAGKTVSDLASFKQIMSGYQPGDTVDVTVSRSGQSMTYSLTLGELKA